VTGSALAKEFDNATSVEHSDGVQEGNWAFNAWRGPSSSGNSSTGSGRLSGLDQKIAQALSVQIASADVEALIADVEVAATAADTPAHEARVQALDPVASPDADHARAAMEAAAFKRERCTPRKDRMSWCCCWPV
jgi:hypothetical protein